MPSSVRAPQLDAIDAQLRPADLVPAPEPAPAAPPAPPPADIVLDLGQAPAAHAISSLEVAARLRGINASHCNYDLDRTTRGISAGPATGNPPNPAILAQLYRDAVNELRRDRGWPLIWPTDGTKGKNYLTESRDVVEADNRRIATEETNEIQAAQNARVAAARAMALFAQA